MNADQIVKDQENSPTAMRLALLAYSKELESTIANQNRREKMLVEALRCAEYAITHKSSDQVFALDSISFALIASPSSTSKWAARFVADWVRSNWEVAAWRGVDKIPHSMRDVTPHTKEMFIEQNKCLFAIPNKE